MSRSSLSFIGVRVIPLVLVLGLVLGWTAVAFAQTSAGGQYGDPTRTPSGNPGSSGSSTSTTVNFSSDDDDGGGSGGGGSGSGGGSSGGGGGDGDGDDGDGDDDDDGPDIEALPATGGPLPLLAVVGAFVLGSAGLLALRRR